MLGDDVDEVVAGLGEIVRLPVVVPPWTTVESSAL